MAISPSNVDLVNRTFTFAQNLGVIQKTVEDYALEGRHVTVNGKKATFWGNCSYLGLNQDKRLKEAVIDAVNRYGLQFSTSRTYNLLPFYDELEDLMTKIFNRPALSVQTTTLGHMAAIPALTSSRDVIIMDQKVHASVQNTVKIAQANGTAVEVIRHNRVDMLENRIQKLKDKYHHIWYMADGIYSMHGDIAPMQNLNGLLNHYDQFWMYVDDSHGMSWSGRNGSGAALAELSDFPEKMVLAVTLDKGYGATGGALVLPNEKLRQMLKNFGSTMIFSAPSSPASLAGAIASAKIHLTDEIYTLQDELRRLISYFLLTAKSLNLPIDNEEATPVFYICVGNTEKTIELAGDLLKRGFLVNPTGFPAVNPKDSGIRMTLTRHMTVQDIYELLTTVAELLDNYRVERRSNAGKSVQFTGNSAALT